MSSTLPAAEGSKKSKKKNGRCNDKLTISSTSSNAAGSQKLGNKDGESKEKLTKVSNWLNTQSNSSELPARFVNYQLIGKTYLFNEIM